MEAGHWGTDIGDTLAEAKDEAEGMETGIQALKHPRKAYIHSVKWRPECRRPLDKPQTNAGAKGQSMTISC